MYKGFYRVYTGFIQGLYRVYTGFILYRVYTGCIRVFTGFIQGLYRVYTGFIQDVEGVLQGLYYKEFIQDV